jgi:acetyl-CoA synthetase
MLGVEKFEPPEEFQARALWNDPKVYEEAGADPEAWWLARARELLDWDVEPTKGLNDSDPPFYKWFEDGRLNASANCLDRHVEAGIGDRVAYHWRGEEGESATSPTPTCTATSSASPTRSRTSASRRATWSGSTCR